MVTRHVGNRTPLSGKESRYNHDAISLTDLVDYGFTFHSSEEERNRTRIQQKYKHCIINQNIFKCLTRVSLTILLSCNFDKAENSFSEHIKWISILTIQWLSKLRNCKMKTVRSYQYVSGWGFQTNNVNIGKSRHNYQTVLFSRKGQRSHSSGFPLPSR